MGGLVEVLSDCSIKEQADNTVYLRRMERRT